MTINSSPTKAAAIGTHAAQSRAIILLPTRDAELTFINVAVILFSYKSKDER